MFACFAEDAFIPESDCKVTTIFHSDKIFSKKIHPEQSYTATSN